MGNQNSSTKSNHSSKVGSFGIHGESIKLSGKYNETMTMTMSPYYQQCVYGSKWHSSHNNKDIITYRLQINSQHGHIGIGLITNDEITNQCFEELPTKIGAYYGIWSGGDEQIGYKQTNQPQGSEGIEPIDIKWGFGTNSLIYITLNVSEKQILFQRHSVEPSIWSTEAQFDDILTGDDIKYKLVISAENISDSVTILEYEHRKIKHDKVKGKRKCIPRLCGCKLPPPPPRNITTRHEEESLCLDDIDRIIESEMYERHECVFEYNQESQRESSKSVDENLFDVMSPFEEQSEESEHDKIDSFTETSPDENGLSSFKEQCEDTESDQSIGSYTESSPDETQLGLITEDIFEETADELSYVE